MLEPEGAPWPIVACLQSLDLRVQEGGIGFVHTLLPHDHRISVQGVPEAPQCGFSNMACRILDAYGESFPYMTCHRAGSSCTIATAKDESHLRTSMSVIMFAGARYGTRNVLADADIREGIKEFTQWPTIPQVREGSSGCASAALCC